MDKTPPDHSRRRWLQRALIIGPATSGWMAAPAWAQAPLRPTPAQAEGPFYPVREPRDADFDLLRHGHQTYSKGHPAWVGGVVLDRGGRPLKGGTVEIWQCDENGHYDHPSDGGKIDPAFQGFGRVVLDAEGRFRFRTIRPAPYEGRTPHIHAKVKLGREELLTTQLYVQGEPGNAGDRLWRRLREADRQAITAPYVPGADGLQADYRLVVSV
jgi:protocatechuate 3,4-dioxygenase beta subunit